MNSPFIQRSTWSAVLLAVSLLLSGVVIAFPKPESTAEEEGGGPEYWLSQMEVLLEKGQTASAKEACMAGLSLHPWNPELSRAMTILQLEQGEAESLHDWMDEVTMGDARLAERLFELPQFEPWLAEARFADLQREAYRQARD